MFEKSKFKKNFPLLATIITDKDFQKKLLNNNEFLKFYESNSSDLIDFLEILKNIYKEQDAINFFKDTITKFNIRQFQSNYKNLKYFIHYSKQLDNNSIEILKNLSWETIKSTNFYDIENRLVRLLFEKYYTEEVLIRGYNMDQLFENTRSLEMRKRLLLLAQNNNLDFFSFVVETLTKYNIDINNLSSILTTEINDRLYDQSTREKLGEEDFIRLILFYFNNPLKKDKEMLDKLLDVHNYELILDIMHCSGDCKFSKYIKENEIGSDIFSLTGLQTIDRLNIICRYISFDFKFDFGYLSNLRHSISNNSIYEEFYNKHNETLDLLQSLNYEIFSMLTIDEQKAIYNYVKSLNKDKKKLLLQEIQDINNEIKQLYKGSYASKINEASIVIDKANISDIVDSKGNKHNVRTYELKDDEPFTFLITVMHHMARLDTMNMYGRPAHNLTIEDPENFCKDLSGGSEIISTSMINDRFIDTFVGPNADVMYIFGDLKDTDILGACYQDGGFPPKIDDEIELFPQSEPMGPDELMRSSMRNNDYNEIAIRRKRVDGTRIMPTAILCYDKINDISLKHAEYFNIPIIVINTKSYKYLSNFTSEKSNNNSFTI